MTQNIQLIKERMLKIRPRRMRAIVIARVKVAMTMRRLTRRVRRKARVMMNTLPIRGKLPVINRVKRVINRPKRRKEQSRRLISLRRKPPKSNPNRKRKRLKLRKNSRKKMRRLRRKRRRRRKQPSRRKMQSLPRNKTPRRPLQKTIKKRKVSRKNPKKKKLLLQMMRRSKRTSQMRKKSMMKKISCLETTKTRMPMTKNSQGKKSALTI